MTCTDLELLTRELDKDPTNHNLLFALGELWEETEPGIGDGVRALVVNGRVPYDYGQNGVEGEHCCWHDPYHNPHYAISILPNGWIKCIPKLYLDSMRGQTCASKAYLAAARAFLKLPKEKQDQYLEGNLEEQ